MTIFNIVLGLIMLGLGFVGGWRLYSRAWKKGKIAGERKTLLEVEKYIEILLEEKDDPRFSVKRLFLHLDMVRYWCEIKRDLL